MTINIPGPPGDVDDDAALRRADVQAVAGGVGEGEASQGGDGKVGAVQQGGGKLLRRTTPQ